MNPSPLPKAWLGYKPSTSGRPLVRVCAWCPDRAEAERQAREARHDVTHGICPACYYRQLSTVMGEREDD